MQADHFVHTITLSSGTVVREYVAPNGVVFGVAWNDPTLPDLEATLGAAFDRCVSSDVSGVPNMPFVSVTVCAPGSTNCQRIDPSSEYCCPASTEQLDATN